MTKDRVREGHATLDMASRKAKGRKIERLLPNQVVAGRRLLEVGVGAGGISHYFATSAHYLYEVDAVDVVDKRQVRDGYKYTQVNSTSLPFDDSVFDVVISNHVIEHVGGAADQLHHLTEIRRVLKASGAVYLAVPSRWMVIEPHFGVPFLSWMPRALRTPYLGIWKRKRKQVYDCEPLQLSTLRLLSSAANFEAEVVSVKAFRLLMEIEQITGWFPNLVAKLPDALLGRFNFLMPTHIAILRKRARDG